MARILAFLTLLTFGCAAQTADVTLKFSSDTNEVHIYTHETTDSTVFDTSSVRLLSVYTPADSGQQVFDVSLKYKKPIAFIARSIKVVEGAILYSKWSNRSKYLPVIKGATTLRIGD